MKVVTLRNIPPELAGIIRQKAEASGLSINKTVISVLEGELQVRSKQKKRSHLYHDLDELAGSWSKKEAAEFEKNLADQRALDPEVWT